LAERAFRTEHLPSPVGVAGQAAARDELTKTIDVKHTDDFSRNTYRGGRFINSPVVTFRNKIDLTSEAQSVDAIIILANIHVHKFLRPDGRDVSERLARGPGSAVGHFGFEDGMTATFALYALDDSDPLTAAKIAIPWSNRTISPGLTISELSWGAAAGTPQAYIDGSGAFADDSISFKDVAIRVVITKDDYVALGLPPIAGFQLRVESVVFYPAAINKTTTLSDTGSVVLGKTALSAIPIQCGVSDG